VCNYSLKEYDFRDCVSGEVVIAHHFPSGTMGFRPRRDERSFWKRVTYYLSFFTTNCFASRSKYPAVCIPSGTRILLTNLSVAFCEGYKIRYKENVLVTMETVNREGRDEDRLFFSNGDSFLVGELDQGQAALIMSNPRNVWPRREMAIREEHSVTSKFILS
jgi:hypothetical protein